MKYIITESKLNRAVGRFLSKEYGDLEIYDHDNQPWVLYVDKNGELIFLYHTKDNELYVTKDIIKFLYEKKCPGRFKHSLKPIITAPRNF